MAELQLSVVVDPGSKLQIESQIRQWEENLERLHCEQFRLRCYMASLQNGELPNPKVNPNQRSYWCFLGTQYVSSFYLIQVCFACLKCDSLVRKMHKYKGYFPLLTDQRLNQTRPS